MFSVTVAAAFLPFLPMLPSQILLNNLLYDASQMTIPTDRVDAEQLARPSHWDIGFIRRFMIRFGPISSLFDFATFAVMLWVFDAAAPLFRSGWFVESLATQTLIVFVIRTRRVPFLRSRPSRPLLVSVGAVVTIGALIPQSPINDTLGFAPLPAAFFGVLVAFVVAYLASVEVAKYFFYKTAIPTAAAPLHRGPTHRIHRLASRWSHHQPLPPVARRPGLAGVR
jgi:P-type Mg2+ transporter